MQSDERVAAAISALRPQISLFRYAVAGTLERAKNTLASDTGPDRARVALGDFAGGLIDASRFAAVSSGSGPLDVIARAVVDRATEVLEALVRAGDEEFYIDVAPGMSAASAIRHRLATLGSAFGAATLVELVRRRTYDPVQHGLPFEGHPFEKWSSGERKLAPPLVVRMSGRDLDAFELAPFLDGCARFVLLLDEPCAPAPLARLISPGVFVAQTGDTKLVEQIADLEAPAVVAVMKGSEARFVHDPRGGPAMWQRIHVTHMPDATPRKNLGARSAWQQRDDLAHLKALVEPPILPENPADALMAAIGSATAGDPAERLTTWLLDQSNRGGVA